MKTKGLIQALGVALYCTMVGTLMFNANKIFGKQDNFVTPIVVLLLFSVSALICSLIVFYRPYLLFFDGKKKEAISLVVATTSWLVVFFIAFLSLAILLK
jgi:uncharacterized membrane protein